MSLDEIGLHTVVGFVANSAKSPSPKIIPYLQSHLKTPG